MRKPYEMITILSGANLEGPAAYRFNRNLYVGGTSNIRARLGDHRRAGMLTVVRSGEVFSCSSTEAALRLEKALIWLLNPSQNQDHPRPSGALWAATLGMKWPIEGWSWYQTCGHVKLDGRVLADSAEIATVGCGCTPWDGWLDKARRHVARVESSVTDLYKAMEEAEEYFDAERRDLTETIENERWDMEREKEAERVCEGCADRDDTIVKLETMLEQAQEAEWTA